MYIRINGERCPVVEISYAPELITQDKGLTYFGKPIYNMKPDLLLSVDLKVIIPSGNIPQIEFYDDDIQDEHEKELQQMEKFLEYYKLDKTYNEFKKTYNKLEQL